MNIEKNIRNAREISRPFFAPFESYHRNIGSLLEHWAAKRPNELYLAYYDDDVGLQRSFSYREFRDMVNRTAQVMTSRLGLKRGDKIATLSYNHYYTAIIYFAAWSLGICVVPINVEEDDPRIEFVLENSESKVFFAMPDLLERATTVAGCVPCIREIVAITGGTGTMLDLATSLDTMPATLPDSAADVAAEDSGLIVYTSGTTGMPKGVELSQYNMLVDAYGMADWYKFKPGARMMCILPIHHVNGIIVTMVTPLYYGGSVVLNRRFRSHAFWRRLADERVECVSLVPTILKFLSDANEDISNYDLRALKYILCGAGPLLIPVAEEFHRKFGRRINHGYGLSETTAYTCFLPIDLTDEKYRYWITNFGYPSIGCAIAPNEMAIFDSEGNRVEPGESGEIVIRGLNVMNGYFKRDDANKDAFRTGWFHSGDQGFYIVDSAGREFFFITARIKEVILRGGTYVYPLEIDPVIQAVPGVQIGLAVGFDNEYQGEEVGAYVVPQPGARLTEDDVLRFCAERLPFPKRPKAVVFGNEVVMTATGKPKRLSLKHHFKDYFGVQFRKTKESGRSETGSDV